MTISQLTSLFLVTLLCVAVQAAVPCSVGQWCWEAGWAMEYVALASTAASFTNAAAACSAVSGTVVDGRREALSMLLALLRTNAALANAAWWTSLALVDPATLALLPSRGPVASGAPAFNLTAMSPCFADATCCFHLTRAGVEGVPCPATNWSVLCARPGVAAEWVTTAVTEMEYGYFTRRANYSEASSVCAAHGGRLAYVPQTPALLLEALAPKLSVSVTGQPVWVGFTTNAAGASVWQAVPGTVVTPSVPFLNNPSFANRCGALSTTATFSRTIACNTSQGFLCQRLAVVAPGAAHCNTSGAVPVLYSYFPPPSQPREGVTPVQAILQCSATGGVMTKYGNVSELAACFGPSARFLATCYSNGVWNDLSSAAIPAFFPAATERCTLFNATGAAPSTGEMLCSSQLPNVCEYTESSVVSAALATGSVTLQQGCVVAVAATVGRPPAWNESVALCRVGAEPADCFPFAPLKTATSITVRGSDFSASQVVFYALVCFPSAICHGTELPLNVTVRSAATNVTLVRLIASTGLTVPVALQGTVGAPFALPALTVASATPFNISATFAILPGTDSDACTVAPQSATLSGTLAAVTLTVFCDGGTRSTAFRVALTTASRDSTACSLNTYTAVPIAAVSMALVYNLTIPNTTFYGFGPEPAVTVLVPRPSSYAGPRWICLTFVQANVSGASGSNACVSSEATSLAVALTFKPNPTDLQSMLLTYNITGNGVGAIDLRGSSLTVLVALAKMNITLNCGLSAIPQYLGLPFAVTATLPFPVKSGFNLSLSSAALLSSPQPWSSPCVNYLNLSLPWLAMAIPVGRTTAQVVHLPTAPTLNNLAAVWNANPQVAVLGNASFLFNAPVSAAGYCAAASSLLVVLSPSVLGYSQLPTYLFYNSQPYPLTVSIPANNPLRGQHFNLTLLCAACPVGSLVLTPPTLVFTTASNTSQSILMAVTLPLQSVQLTWSFSTPRPPQFLAPPSFTLSTQNQSALQAALVVEQFYFANTIYAVRVIARALPPQSNATVVVGFPGITVEPALFNTTSALTQSLYFRLAYAPASKSAALQLVLGGTDLTAFFLQPSAVTASPVWPQINISVKNVPMFLLNTTSTATLTVALDRAPLSYAVTLTLTASAGLTVRPSTLQWLSSNGNTQTFAVSSSTLSNPNAFVSIAVASTMTDGENTNETSPSVLWCSVLEHCTLSRTGTVPLPVMFPSVYAVMPAVSPFPMRIGDQVAFNLSIAQRPFAGNVTFRFTGFSSLIAVQPRELFFNETSPTTRQQFVVTAVAPTTTLLLIPVVEGPGSVFFLPPRALCLYVDRPIAAAPRFPELSGSTLVVGQAILNGSIGLTLVDIEQCTADGAGTVQLQRQLPAPGAVLSMGLSSTPPGALSFVPSVLTWRAGDALVKRILMAPTGTHTGPVTVHFNTTGNATTYVNSTVGLTIRPQASVAVQFPQEAAYPSEQLGVIVNVSSVPVVCTTALTVEVTLECLTARCAPSLVDITPRPQFTCGSATEQTFALSMKTIDIVTTFQITIVFSGSAMGEYALERVVTTSTINFYPRRTATLSFPAFIFVSSAFAFNVTLSAPPDPGATLHFRAAGYQLAQVIFSSTSPTAQTIALIAPYMQETGFLNITLSGSTPHQTNRYEPLEPVFITVREKVAMRLLQPTPMRTSQVIGRLNYQTVAFAITKAPIFPFTATLAATSSVGNLLFFDPPSVSFSPDDVDLARAVNISGTAVGLASNVRFVLSGFLEELADPDPDHKILPVLLAILPLQSVRFNSTFTVMYVGADNRRNVSLFLSRPCNLPVVVGLNFSFPWAAKIEPSTVVFSPEQQTQAINVSISGLYSATGLFLVALESGPEFSPVIDGFMQLTIIPRITVSIYRSGVQLLASSTTDLDSDTFNPFDLTISSTDLEDDGVYNLTLVRHSGGSSSFGCTQACYLIVNDSFRFPSAASIAQGTTAQGFTRNFGIAAAAKIADNFTLVLTAIDQPKFEPGFRLFFRVTPEPVLNVTVPAVLYDGGLNAKSFTVGITQVHQGSLTYRYVMSNTTCSTLAIQVIRDLSFSLAIQVPVRITIAGNYSAVPCVLAFRKVAFLQTLPAFFARFPADFFLLAAGTIQLRRSPTVVPRNGTSGTLVPVLPFRLVQRSTQLLIADIVGVRLRPDGNFSYTILDERDDAGIRAARQTYDVIVTTRSSINAEPRGLLSLRLVPKLIDFSDGNETRFAMAIGPVAELLLASDEVVTVALTNNAFSEKVFPDPSVNGFSFVIEKYVASIVTVSDQIFMGTLSLAGFAAMPFASPAIIPQLYKANSLVLLFACPNGQWFLEIWPFPQLGSEPDTLPTWMAISAGATGAVLFIAALHATLVFGVYVYRRSTHTADATTVTQAGAAEADLKITFSAVAGAWHFPATIFCLGMAVAQPIATFAFATLYYSTLPSTRIVAFLCVVCCVVVFPVFFHGIVWRSRSLVFIPYLGGVRRVLPSGFWDHPSSATYIARYWPLFSDLRRNYRWYVLGDYLAVVFTAAVIAIQPKEQTGCVAKVVIVTIVVLVQLFGAVFLQPYRFQYLNFVVAAVFALQFAGLVMLVYQVNQVLRNDAMQTQSLRIFTASSVLMVLASFSTVAVRCVPHESKTEARKRFYAEQELNVEPDDDISIDERQPVPAVPNSDSDEDPDPVAKQLVEELAQLPAAARERRPIGLFRSGRHGYLRGSEQVFSPLRRGQLRQRDRLTEMAPVPALILPELDELPPPPSPQGMHWIHGAEESPQAQQRREASEKVATEQKRACRFVESSELL